MVQIGSLLQSTRRLLQEIEGTELLELPVPPLPVRLHLDDDGHVTVDVLVTLAEQDPGSRERIVGSLRELGLRMTTQTGRIIAGYVRANDIDAFEGLDADVLIEAAHAVHPELDISVPETHAGPRFLPPYLSGRGVVIGIVDSGVDITHPSLRWPSGRTRILRLWDQTLYGAAAPPSAFTNGSEWDRNAIDSYLSSSSGAPFPSVDRRGHGTAVAGIAASNGLAAPKGRYVGVAESADLVIVTIEARRGTFASSANVVDAVKYIFDVAEAMGRRAVVNLSHGAQLGPHDPRGQFEQAISELLIADERRILVKSAGNTGTADAHASVTVPDRGSVDLNVDVPRRVGPYVVAEFWYDSADFLAAEVTDSTGAYNLLVEGNRHSRRQMGSDQCEITGIPVVLGIRANQIMVVLSTVSGQGNVTPGRWTIRLHGRHVTSGQPVHAWLEQGSIASSRFATNADSDCTVTAPGMADEVVVVSGYELSPTLGAFLQKSGRGPNRRCQALRGLAAPGDPITSCAASTRHATAHAVWSGTSFAAPHVTGAIALMLQTRPMSTRKQILDCLLHSARSDHDVSMGPATGWGSGKLCVDHALKCIFTT
jgi:subtilisin family serine protease